MSRAERAALFASLLLWAACLRDGALTHTAARDASMDASDAAEPDASYADLCPIGTAGTPCSPCPAGSFCPGGTAPMALCLTNTFDDDQDPKTPCVAASSCQRGSYVVTPYSRVTDQHCAPCPAGSFSTEVNTRRCSDFRRCAQDEFIRERGSATRDHVCQRLRTCTGDEYEHIAPTIQSDRACTARTTCTSGQYVSMQPTATRDRTCAACATGYFSTSDNAHECLPWRVCAAHESERRAPSDTRDRECACQTGSEEDAGTCTEP